MQAQAALTGRIPLSAPGADDEPEMTDDGEPVPAERTQVVDPKTRMMAAEGLLNRIHGRSAPSPEETDASAAAYEAIMSKILVSEPTK